MLSDAQNWIIVSAADDVFTAVLARALSVPYNTVNNAWWRYRREGRVYGVRYVSCEECGDLLTNDLPTNARRRYHPGCRAQGRERVVRAGHVRRWAVKGESQHEAIQDRGRAYQADAQAASLPSAINRGALWSAADDAYLLERVDLDSTATLAKALGRTYRSVIGRLLGGVTDRCPVHTAGSDSSLKGGVMPPTSQAGLTVASSLRSECIRGSPSRADALLPPSSQWSRNDLQRYQEVMPDIFEGDWLPTSRRLLDQVIKCRPSLSME